MSFFFDIWTHDGFVLASDVRTVTSNGQGMAHKLFRPPASGKVVCAMATCGDYFEASHGFFQQAVLVKDTLREVAHAFASKWTERFAGATDYSAVHLVGFEKVGGSALPVPQMWYWYNRLGPDHDSYRPQLELERELASFESRVPANNHIPQKIRVLVQKVCEPTLEAEADLVRSFLKIYEPFFTWNGDDSFWMSAAGVVGSAMNLLAGTRPRWKIQEVAELAGFCLEFLAKVGGLLPSSSVGLSPTEGCDVLSITPDGITSIKWANVGSACEGHDSV